MSKTNPKTRPAWVTSVSIAIPIDPKDPQQAVAAKDAIETALKSLPPDAVAEITRASFGRMDVPTNGLQTAAPSGDVPTTGSQTEESEIPEHMRRLPRARGG